MPRYEYACTSCDERLEVVQAFTDEALTDCPVCEDGRLRKLFGAVGVVFKGSGFYRTDSRENAKSSLAASRKADSANKAESSASGTPATSGNADSGGSKSGSASSASKSSRKSSSRSSSKSASSTSSAA